MSNKIDVDLLTEDTPIPGQEYGVYSFLSPEGIKGCTVRAFKNRGSFATYEEASKYAEKIRNLEPTFHVFVGENFKWTAFDPDPNLVKDNSNYYEPKLQELMKGTIENQEKAKEYEAQRKRQMIEDSIKEEIKKKKEFLLEKKKELEKKEGLNQYLELVKKEYFDFYEEEVNKKKMELQAMTILNDYIHFLEDEKHLVNNQTITVKHDKKEILHEINKIKKELQKVTRS